MLLLFISLLLMGLDCLQGAPTGKEVYRMPQSALKALSDRGTVVLEAAMASALSALERASSDRSRAEASCRGCVPCLFQNCGQLSGSCSTPSGALLEPTCEVISKAQKLQDEAERSWALSQACGYYQHRCLPNELNTESCIRIMGESCSARVLQCSLLNTMQNLEPDMQSHAQAACGQRSFTVQNITQPRSRIVGGSPAPLGSWPWLVNLQLNGELMCGGVLVDSSWVATAAHCFAGSRSESYWTAVVGEFDITKKDPDEQVLKVNRIIPHPKFNPKTFNNDIALVELTSPVVLSEYVTPVCLPTATDPPTGSPCLVAGWGSLYEDGPSADVVMEAKVPLLPQSTCKSALGKELVTNTMLCAGYLSGGIDSCQGDSGGPLIYQDRISGRFQLSGITSWGDGCGEKGKPGVYTRVSAFSDWIQAEIQKSLRSREPTCPELLKTTDMTEAQQRSEFNSLCHFYTLPCPPGQSASACSQIAEEKCLTRFKKCQLRAFLQTLLDLLQRAEDYIRDKMDLTFFTQTLPQLVEHIYSAAFTHNRERRDLGLTWIKEQLGGAVTPATQEPPHSPPALFGYVGPSVDEWEEHLKSIADELDKHQDGITDTSSAVKSNEEKIFLQDSLVQHLAGHYQSVISSLHSRLGSRVAPPLLHLDAVRFQEGSSINPSSTITPGYSPLSSLSQKSLEPWSLLSVLLGELGKLQMQDKTMDDGASITEEHSSRDVSSERNTALEDFGVNQDGEQFKPSAAPLMDLLTSAVQKAVDMAHTETPDPRRGRKSSGVRRGPRSVPQKRQIPGKSGKICPGLRESAQQVSQIQESYSWILNIPSDNLQMNFQEVLVDLTSKNDRGLYQARIRAVVAGRPSTFYSLVGLENESFYRSVPRIIAVALDSLKT
ncbi:PREDICTED: serine protease 56 isoform X2 [Cyprinodon variegatus]|uniref:serine protease 56 isoform X2 n=1 Tax=Cyprinodon variegatus TaxID=28743 RepID=UPI0007426DE4|nr:PREDICTED: serine protease 56 isoform X2 [Cyprinodon variegatus]